MDAQQKSSEESFGEFGEFFQKSTAIPTGAAYQHMSGAKQHLTGWFTKRSAFHEKDKFLLTGRESCLL